jgi:hypothetical protein
MTTPTTPHDETGSRTSDRPKVAKLEVAFTDGVESAVTILYWTRARAGTVAVGHALCAALRPLGTATIAPNRFSRPSNLRPAMMIRWSGIPLER